MCLTYFAGWFPLPFCDDQRKVIGKIEAAVLNGLLSAYAMPRGSGKTTISKVAALWAIMYGHCRWVEVIAATGPMSHKMLESLKKELRINKLLLDDFPEVCQPIRHLEGSPLRARGQHCNGIPTYIEWGKDCIVFPQVPGTKCGESRVTCHGIEGAIRGQQASTSRGEMMRPDLVLADDPQTKSSANSLSETEFRREVIMGDVLGLAGPNTKIAGLVPCTLIRKGDLADFLTDPKQAPEFRGERTRMVYTFPTDDKGWEEYFRIRENDLAAGGDGAIATEYYLANQASLDKGARVAWESRHPGFATAIEYAMYLRYRNPAVFAAEYQNEPVEQDDANGTFLSTIQVISRQNGYDRGKIPHSATCLTGFVDVQQDVLFWLVAAWEPNFTGYVVDYGAWPKQNKSYYSLRTLRNTLATRYKGMGAEAAIFAGMKELTEDLVTRSWVRTDGVSMKLDRLMVDSGDNTATVYSFTQQTPHAAIIQPSKGRGVSAANVPFSDFIRKPGERLGDGWLIKPVASNRAIRLTEYDTNHWKTFVQLRLATNIGDAGSLTLFKATHYDHRLIAEHITAETPVRTEGRGRALWEWKNVQRNDNHWLDCLVGAAVGASIQGIALGDGVSSAVSTPVRKKVAIPQHMRRA